MWAGKCTMDPRTGKVVRGSVCDYFCASDYFCVSPQGATQQSVDCESLTQTQGATQKSVDCGSLTSAQGATQQSVD